MSEKLTQPIACEKVCSHYVECIPYTEPVACTKIELWDDVAESVEHAGYFKLPSPDSKGCRELRDKLFEILDKNYVGDEDIDASNYHHSGVIDKVLSLLRGE